MQKIPKQRSHCPRGHASRILPTTRLTAIPEQNKPGPGGSQFLCAWKAKAGRARRREGAGPSEKPKEQRASPPGPAAAFAKTEREEKAADAPGSGGRYVATGVADLPLHWLQELGSFYWQEGLTLPGTANNLWHLALEACSVFDNQALLSSLPHPQPGAEGKLRQAGVSVQTKNLNLPLADPSGPLP